MAERISLDDTPVIDAHCFLYEESPLNKEDLYALFSLGGVLVGSIANTSPQEVARQYAENTITYRRFMKELSRLLSCEPTTEEVLAARSARAKDFKGYESALMNDAAVKTLVVDNSTKELSEVDAFGRRFPGSIRKTYRLETLIKALLETSHTFDSLVSGFDAAVANAVKRDGCVAFKSIIAYRSGLDIRKVTEGEAKKDFDKRADQMRWFGPYVKNLRDFLIRRALVSSITLQVPFLIHAGLGDTDIVASRCNPALLLDLLRDEEVLPATVVLIHGGFPYTYEAGWLANVLPNVYFELSSSLPPYLEPPVSARRFGEVLQWVPMPKLVYGSDSGDFPETAWYYARVAKRAMAQALNELVGSGDLTSEEAQREGENIFYNNAQKLFGI